MSGAATGKGRAGHRGGTKSAEIPNCVFSALQSLRLLAGCERFLRLSSCSPHTISCASAPSRRGDREDCRSQALAKVPSPRLRLGRAAHDAPQHGAALERRHTNVTHAVLPALHRRVRSPGWLIQQPDQAAGMDARPKLIVNKPLVSPGGPRTASRSPFAPVPPDAPQSCRWS